MRNEACLACLFAFQGEWTQGVDSEPLTFSNLEAENAAADGAYWAQEKCVLWLHFFRGGSGIVWIVSYGQNLVVFSFCQESVFSKDAQFDLVECI